LGPVFAVGLAFAFAFAFDPGLALRARACFAAGAALAFAFFAAGLACTRVLGFAAGRGPRAATSLIGVAGAISAGAGAGSTMSPATPRWLNTFTFQPRPQTGHDCCQLCEAGAGIGTDTFDRAPQNGQDTDEFPLRFDMKKP
jgi:hypothetical protein